MSEPLDLAALRRVAEGLVASRRVIAGGTYRYDDVRLSSKREVMFTQAATPAVVLELVRRVEEAEGKR